jgi:uncharacterized protein (DUF488 family)
MTSSPILWTIGHSTRPIGKFIELLDAYNIRLLIDVRTIPRSRHNPQFNTEALKRSLTKEGLKHLHMSALGGLRKPKKDSINRGWRNTSFRGYADYMQTGEFWKALEALMTDGRSQTTAIMCAEAVPWRCHRSLIADALLSRGWVVRHILSEGHIETHRLTSFASIEGRLLSYPSEPAENPRLF